MTTTNDLPTLLATAVDERITKTLSLHESQTALAQALTPQVESIAASALLNALIAMAQIPAKALGLTVSTEPSAQEPARRGRKPVSTTSEGEVGTKTRRLRLAKPTVPTVDAPQVSDAGTRLEDFVSSLPQRRVRVGRDPEQDSPQTEYAKRVRARKRIEAIRAALPATAPAEYVRGVEEACARIVTGSTSQELFAIEDTVKALVIEGFKALHRSASTVLAATEEAVETLEADTAEASSTSEDDLDSDHLDVSEPLDLADDDDTDEDEDEDEPEDDDEDEEEPMQVAQKKTVKVVARPSLIATRTRSGTPIVVATRTAIDTPEVQSKRRVLDVDPDFV